MVMPLTGALAGAGKQVVAGARFYMRQHGDLVAGKKLELIVRDDATVFDVIRLIQELIVNDKVNWLWPHNRRSPGQRVAHRRKPRNRQ